MLPKASIWFILFAPLVTGGFATLTYQTICVTLFSISALCLIFGIYAQFWSQEAKAKKGEGKSLTITLHKWAIGLSGMTGYPVKPANTCWLRLEVAITSTYTDAIDTLDLLIGNNPIPVDNWNREKITAFTAYFNIDDWKYQGEIQIELRARIGSELHSSGRKKINTSAEVGGFPQDFIK